VHFFKSRQQLASRDGIRNDMTGARLALLCMHCPRLRILWCSSPSEAAEMFEELKENRPQPDPAVAMSIKSDQIIETDGVKFNPILSVSFLIKIAFNFFFYNFLFLKNRKCF
jgi:hypothetical protein